MSSGSAPRQGDIYWLDHCPPLAGEIAKRRPVVVISPSEITDSGSGVLIVAAMSTQVLASRAPDRIPMPNKEQNPGCSTGLSKPCWLVPQWFLVVDRSRLQDRAGSLSPRLRRRVVAAVMARMDAAKPD